MRPTKFIWDSHHLVGLIWILINQRGYVKICVVSIPRNNNLKENKKRLMVSSTNKNDGGWRSKQLCTQPIKIFRIVTSINILINILNLCDSLKCFDWLYL